MSTDNLTSKQQLFVAEYLKDLNATQAAIRAGYAASGARTEGARLLANADIQAAVEKSFSERTQRVKVDADLVLRELLALATVDLAAAYDEQGHLKDIHDIPANVRKAIAGIEVDESLSGLVLTKKIKFWDRPRALEMLGRHIALFNDKLGVEHSGPNGGPIKIDDTTAANKIAAIFNAVLATKPADDDVSDLA